MKKELSFIIEGKEIYNDFCLVRDEIPIFFTCVDEEENRYLALCTDMDIPRYSVIQVSIVQLNNMLKGILSMKEIFTLQRKYWEITPTDDDITHDEVLCKNISELDEEDLPDDGAYFELFNDELKRYAKSIHEKMLNGEYVSTSVDNKDLLIIQNMELPEYKEEDGCVQIQTSYRILIKPDIAYKILVSDIKDNSLLAAV